MSQDAFQKIVYLARHGQSEGNLGSVFQSNESPLNKVGLKQAEQLAYRMSKLDFDLLISSPWVRAKQTAEAISKATSQPIEYSELFVERVRPTGAVGKSKSDQTARQLEDLWYESLYDPDLRAEDGENYSDLLSRADNALSFLEAKTESKIVVATHGYFLRTLVARVLLSETLTPVAFRSMQTHVWHQNTGITALAFGQKRGQLGWSLWIYNDYAHLAE